MDKVYARIISVSLLLSLCGAGVVSPRLCRTIFVTEAEPALVRQVSASSLLSSARGRSLCGLPRAKSPFRRFFTSISSRLAEICAGARSCCGERPIYKQPDGRKISHVAAHQCADVAQGVHIATPVLPEMAECGEGFAPASYASRAGRVAPIRAGPSMGV